MKRTCSRCLVMTFGAKGVGDHMTASPVVRALAENFPGCSIDLAVFSPVGRELFKYHPSIRTIHQLDMNYLKPAGNYRLREKIAYIKIFRRERYDRVYVLGSKFRHALFAFLTGAPVRVGYDNANRGWLLTLTGKEPLEKNIVERFLDLLRMDGLAVSNPYLELYLSDKERGSSLACLEQHGIARNENVLAIAPFAADMRRTWGLDRFWEIARLFVNDHRSKVIVLGSTEDRKLMDGSPMPQHPLVIDLVGKLTLLETAAVIERSNLFLSNDSGLGHIAGAVGTRSLILGYFMTRSWYPMSRSANTIIKDTGCTSCKVDECRRYRKNGLLECFDEISVDEVAGRLREMGLGKGPERA